jgi:hypothetical protein
MSRKLIVLLFVAVIACASYGDQVADGTCDLEDCVVIGDWELNNDGWIDWGNKEVVDSPNNMPPYFYEPDVGVTLGDYSLGLPADGWAQTLSIKLSAAQREEFMDHTCFCIDVSTDAATCGGWVEIYALSANVDGFDWGDVGDVPAWHQDRWDGAGEVTVTLCWDYSDFKPSETPGYAEFIIATNGASDCDPHNLYFDNARLCTPEPMSVALLGLGGLLLRRRKR